MIADKLITVGDIVKTGYLDLYKGKNPIYHRVVGVYWDNLTNETLYELHYLQTYFLKPFQMDYIKWTILANNEEMNMFRMIGYKFENIIK